MHGDDDWTYIPDYSKDIKALEARIERIEQALSIAPPAPTQTMDTPTRVPDRAAAEAISRAIRDYFKERGLIVER